SQLVPESKWLVEHLPSPPIEKILREYLPTLPVRMKLPGQRVTSPPEQLLSRLKNGISKGNDLIHVGVETVEIEFLDEVLDAVAEVLRLLDYYGGHEWALRYLSIETKQALGLVGT